jgi:mono/diheme cytochrome c family protein
MKIARISSARVLDPHRRGAWYGRLAACLAAVSLVLTGCGGAGMFVQPRYDPLEPADFYADGRSARNLPAGAVSVGNATAGNPVLSGKDASGAYVQDIPIPVTEDLMKQGEQRYNIYCAPCHGVAGGGNGVITQHGLKDVPSFHTKTMYDMPAGQYFDTMTNGYGRMLSYGYRVKPEERWAIVAYIRALQLSQNTDPNLLTPEERQKLGSQP